MSNKIMLLIRQMEVSLEQLGKMHLNALDISPAQSFALEYLLTHQNETVYSTDLHEQFGFSKASISAALKELKNKGYLEMVTNPSDTRKKRLLLTPRAYEIEQEINAILVRQQDTICRGISPAQQQRMEKGLNTMLCNIKQELVRRNDT